MFEKFSPIPPDPILKLIAEHNNDVRANKIDLGVGVYRDASGVTPIMKVVKVAEEYLLNKQKSKAYIGLAGCNGGKHRHHQCKQNEKSKIIFFH